MKNRRNSIIIVAIAVVAIVALATTFILVKDKLITQPVQDTSNDTSETFSGSDTYKKYAALKGDEYDKTFISNMIVHHESAMNMAEMAMGAAKRQEVKDLAMNIASSQGSEVAEMVTWQEQWGYPETSGHMMVDAGDNAAHSMDGMATMNDELEGLSGDVFDRKFLELMIVHHQDAIDMAMPADTNAKHQEVKDLAKAIISAQSSEIEQMQSWQKSWGFEVTNSDSPSTHV